MEFAVQTSEGNYRFLDEKTESEVTHVIMDYGEYDYFRAEFWNADKKLKKMESELENLKEELSLVREEKNRAEMFNNNLLRIMRERANAARKIVPKKKRDGYVILFCRQYSQKYVEEKPAYGYEKFDREWLIKHRKLVSSYKVAEVWKMTIETPYHAGLILDNIRETIERELIKSLLLECGITQINSAENNGIYKIFRNSGNEKIPGVYKWEYRCNFSSGLWDVDLWVTELPQIPMNRWPKKT